jgi:hypothetical protein
VVVRVGVIVRVRGYHPRMLYYNILHVYRAGPYLWSNSDESKGRARRKHRQLAPANKKSGSVRLPLFVNRWQADQALPSSSSTYSQFTR